MWPTRPCGDAGGVHFIIQADAASRRGLIQALGRSQLTFEIFIDMKDKKLKAFSLVLLAIGVLLLGRCVTGLLILNGRMTMAQDNSGTGVLTRSKAAHVGCMREARCPAMHAMHRGCANPAR